MNEIRDVMREKVLVIESLSSLADAAKKMDDNGVGCLIVVSGHRITGIVTDTDMRKCIAESRDPASMKVDDVMTTSVITIEADKSIEDAVELMKSKTIKKLPVVEEGKLVGIITATDIVVLAPKMVESVARLLSYQPA